MVLALLCIRYCLQDYAYGASVFMWIKRIIWSLAISYIIVACAYGYGGIVNWFLSQPMWFALSRLSYAAYLSQEMVLFAFAQYPYNYSPGDVVSVTLLNQNYR